MRGEQLVRFQLAVRTQCHVMSQLGQGCAPFQLLHLFVFGFSNFKLGDPAT